jgi:hypothetical protein
MTGDKTPMTYGSYLENRGLLPLGDENLDAQGYLLEREDGALVWYPEEMTFGNAIEAAKQGKRIARAGWNGKGMFVVYQKGYPEGIPCNKNTAEAWGLNEGDLFVVQPYLQIQNVNKSHSMWVPSINDCLAEDWMIVA